MFDDVPQFLHLKLMCLALMVKHHWIVVEHFNANHIVLASGQLFQDEEILHQLDNNPNCVVVTCRILGLTAFDSLLQYVNWLVWEVCSVN